MKRILAALAALLIATPSAATVVVVRYPVSSVPYGQQKQWAGLSAMLTEYGATWDQAPSRETSVAKLKAQTVTRNGHDYTYDVVIHFGADINFSNPCSYTLAANWPSGVHVFIGAPTGGAFQWTQTGACSTGTDGYNTPYPDGYDFHSAYLVGGTQAWKAPTSNLFPLTRHGTAPPGIFRWLVATSASQMSRRLSPTSSQPNFYASNPDSIGRSANPDTGLCWIREPVGNPARRLIFVQPGIDGYFNEGVMKIALNAADSASGGRVWEDSTKIPRRRSFVVRQTDATGDTTTSASDFAAGGMVTGQESNVYASIDSLGLTGERLTFLRDPDLLVSARTARLWQYPNIHHGLEPYSGTTAGTGTTFSSTAISDLMGHLRTRIVWGGGTCVGRDTSIVCGLQWAWSTLGTAVGAARIDHVLAPAYFDWSPVSDSRSSWAKTDSLPYYLRRYGDVRAILVNPLSPNANVGRSWSANVGVHTSGSDPWGLIPQGRSVPVPSTFGTPSRISGYLNFVAIRFEGAKPQFGVFQGGHSVQEEWAWGNLTKRWYPDLPTLPTVPSHYSHDFETRTPVMVFNLNELGGAPAGYGIAGAVCARNAWWAFKWTNDQMKAANAVGLPGKKLDVWDYVENLRPMDVQ